MRYQSLARQQPICECRAPHLSHRSPLPLPLPLPAPALQDDGGPFLEAGVNGDLAALRTLRALGCPWAPDTAERAVFDEHLMRGCSTQVGAWGGEEGYQPELSDSRSQVGAWGGRQGTSWIGLNWAERW